jgi:hypothetical protein
MNAQHREQYFDQMNEEAINFPALSKIGIRAKVLNQACNAQKKSL